MQVKFYTKDEIKDIVAEAVADLATDMTMDENAPKGLGIQSVLWGAILMEKIDKVIDERIKNESSRKN